MDLQAYVLDLIAPLSAGDSLVPGVRFDGVSIELGARLRFMTAQGPLLVEIVPRDHAGRWAVDAGPWVLSYRAGTSDAAVEPSLGMLVCRAVATKLTSNRVSQSARMAAPRIREVDVPSILEWRELGSQSHYTVSPYVGCTIGCRFCYAQRPLAGARAMMGLPVVPWGSYVDVRTNAAEVLRRELETASPAPIKFCPIVSDPYQAVERDHRRTRACLDVLASAPDGFTTMLLTRSSSILEDADRIAALPAARVGVSLPTADHAVLTHFEPRAAPLEARLEILRTFAALGVPTMAIVQPLLPGSLERLADTLAQHADSVSLGGLMGSFAAADLFEHPDYAGTSDPAWQRDRLDQLEQSLHERNVPLWRGELPPDLRSDGP